jgi:hypothetical protein
MAKICPCLDSTSDDVRKMMDKTVKKFLIVYKKVIMSYTNMFRGIGWTITPLICRKTYGMCSQQVFFNLMAFFQTKDSKPSLNPHCFKAMTKATSCGWNEPVLPHPLHSPVGWKGILHSSLRVV